MLGWLCLAIDSKAKTNNKNSMGFLFLPVSVQKTRVSHYYHSWASCGWSNSIIMLPCMYWGGHKGESILAPSPPSWLSVFCQPYNQVCCWCNIMGQSTLSQQEIFPEWMGSASPLRTSGYSKEIRILLQRGEGTRSTVTYCGYTLCTHLKWVAPVTWNSLKLGSIPQCKKLM